MTTSAGDESAPSAPTASDATSPDRAPIPPRMLNLGTALVALAVGLLGFALVVVSGSTRDEGELDWSYTGVQIAVVALALAGGLAARFVAGDVAHRGVVAGWPLALAGLGAGAVVTTFVNSSENEAYLVGGVVVAVAVAGYLLAPGGACALTAVVGLAVLVARGVDDGLSPDGGTEGFRIAILAMAAFAIVVTSLGWALPRARHVVAGFVGAGVILGLVGVAVVGQLSSSFLEPLRGVTTSERELDAHVFDEPSVDLDQIAYYLLGAGAALVCYWLLLAILSGAVVPRVLAVGATVALVPVGVWLLGDEPLWWAVSAVVVGALVLGMAVVLGRVTGAPPERSWTPVEPPPAPTNP